MSLCYPFPMLWTSLQIHNLSKEELVHQPAFCQAGISYSIDEVLTESCGDCEGVLEREGDSERKTDLFHGMNIFKTSSFGCGKRYRTWQGWKCLKVTGMSKTKGQTLHAGGAESLPGQEDGMVVMLRVLWILFLLDDCPAAHVFQASRRVATLNEADGLRKRLETH